VLDEARYVNSIDRILHLRAVPLLAELASTEVAAIAEHMRPRAFGAGQLILEAGQAVTAGYSVVEGRVSLRHDGNVIGVAGPLEAFGMAGLWSEDPSDVEVRAEVDTLTLEIRREPLMEVLEDQFPILRHLLSRLARNILALRRPMKAAGFGPANELAFPFPEHAIDLVERLFVLRRIPPFARASLDALAELARHQTEVRLEPGHVLWQGGEPADYFLAILHGEVSCKTPTGTFGVGPRQGVGALEAVAGLPRWYEATVVKDLVALRSNVESTMDVFEDHPRLAIGMLGALSQDLRSLLAKRG
jgi:CRP-like cAMP-binding protein